MRCLVRGDGEGCEGGGMPDRHTVLLEGVEHSCEGVEVCAVGG